MTLFRVLMKHDDVPEVPEPSKNNMKVVPAPKPDEEVLAALDPDGVYDHEVHGL